MSSASEVIALAEQELGYHEKASNSNLDSKTANSGSNNYTKYARDLAQANYYNGNKNGFAWCDVFVDWLFYKLYGKEQGQYIECQTGELGAACPYSAQYYKNAGRYGSTPRVGAQAFFQQNGSIVHTGIVIKYTDSTVTTIEGNSSNAVTEHTYKRSDPYIAGYGYPRYSSETPSTEKKKWQGIDVSNWQGSIDWQQVAASGIDFVIIRAGYGKNNIDSRFKEYAKGAKAAGLDIGYYWFSYALNAEEAKGEASYLCNAIEELGIKPTYPLCYDYEYDSYDKARAKGMTPSRQDLINMANAFLSTVEQRGYYAMNYTNLDFLDRGFSELDGRYDLWLAQWGTSAASRKCGIWQYSANGSVKGISGNADMDISYVNYPSIIKGKFDGPGEDVVEPTKVYPYGKASETTGIIRKGAKGQDVKAIQWALNELGYGNSGTNGVDGKFGTGTKNAVKAFQKAMFPNKKSEWDGEVGNNTRAKFAEMGY